MLFLILTAAQILLGGLEFQVYSIDGTLQVGELHSLGRDELTLRSAKDEMTTRIPLETTLKLTAKTTGIQPAPENPGVVQVSLRDGSRLTTANFFSDGKLATVILDDHSANVEMQYIEAVQLQRGTAALSEQWDDIRNTIHTGDVLVIRKSEDALDFLEGVVTNITAEHVDFRFDEEDMNVKREKLFGILYYSPEQSGPEQRSTASLTFDFGSFEIADVRIENQIVNWTTTAGAKFKNSVSALRTLDFGAGKILYLSDADPASLRLTPKFGSALGDELTRLLYAPRRDESFEGGKLQLRYWEQAKIKTFAKGLALHSRTQVSFRLNKEFRSLRGVAGMDPNIAAGQVQLTITADGESLMNERIEASTEPRDIDLDVSGKRRLTLIVDYGDELDVADRLNLCDLRVVK